MLLNVQNIDFIHYYLFETANEQWHVPQLAILAEWLSLGRACRTRITLKAHLPGVIKFIVYELYFNCHKVLERPSPNRSLKGDKIEILGKQSMPCIDRNYN